jgi:dTDP-4-dehydrorhamnose reductase
MKKILILGATGMLGSALYDVLKNEHHLVLSVRDVKKLNLLEKAYGSTKGHQVINFDAGKLFNEFAEKKSYPHPYLADFVDKTKNVDYIINAIGVTIPYTMENPALTFFINSMLPNILAREYGPRLIHITTDCVFNGKEGFPYSENSSKTPVDIYGASKSLGEPETALTIRTSIIGKELEGFTGFLDWFLRQEGKEINGFSKHYWNGLTTKQFAKICSQIIKNPSKYPRTGLYHVFSNPVTKYEMLQKFKKKFGINCKIHKFSQNPLNRTLTTTKRLNGLLDIPSFDKMLEEI